MNGKESRIIGICSFVTMLLLSGIPSGFAQTTSEEVHFDRSLEWVLTSNMVVVNPRNPIYNNTAPPMGGVFLVYDMNAREFGNRIHVPSAAEYVKLTADLARLGHEQEVIYRLGLVSDFLMASTTTVTLADNVDTTAVVPVWIYKEDKGFVGIDEEIYTRDNLNAALALLKAYQVTKREAYAEKARELLDTTILLQNLEEEKVQKGELPAWTSGSLPWLIYNYEARGNHEVTSKDLDLSLTDVVWSAFTLGYNTFGDERYLASRDKYFEFILRSYQISGDVPRYPFQFISDRGGGTLYFANFNSVEKEWDIQEPFTTDMAFYQVTGLLMNEDEKYKQLGTTFLEELSFLQKGYFFEDSYYPDGRPVGYGNASIAAGQYLAALTLEGSNISKDQIITSIYQHQLYDPSEEGSLVYNGAWEWSAGSRLVESMATIVIIHSLILSPSMIPHTAANVPSSSFPTPALTLATLMVLFFLMRWRVRR